MARQALQGFSDRAQILRGGSVCSRHSPAGRSRPGGPGARPAAHAGQAYPLTGPAALALDEVARLLSQRLGRPIRYQPASALGYVQHLLRQGAPLGQAAVLTILHLGLRRGQAAGVDPTLARLLGRPGRTLAEYIEDHAELFAAE